MIDTKVLKIPVVLPQDEDCERCVGRLHDALLARKGVEDVHVNVETATLTLHYDPNLISLAEVEQAAREDGVAVASRFSHYTMGLSGLDCADCAQTVEKSLLRLEGILWATLNFATAKLTVEYDAERTTLRDIVALIRRLGYDVESEGRIVVARYGLASRKGDEDLQALDEALTSLSGVIDVRIDRRDGAVNVTYDQERISASNIMQAIAAQGYEPSTGVERDRVGGPVSLLASRRRDVLTAVAGLSIFVGAVIQFSGLSDMAAVFCYAMATLAAGFDVARSGLASLRTARTLDINVLMTIAVIGALAIGEWAEAATVMFLFSLGNLLESFSASRARNAIRALMKLAPSKAMLVRDGWMERVPVADLSIGDIVAVRPGERLPMDGVVVGGVSVVDQAPITGESVPVEKREGDDVYAGTVNGQGALEVRVSRLAKDSTVSRILHMVEEAQSQKARSERFVDRFSRYYTPGVIGAAAAIAVLPPLLLQASFTTWLYRALVLLVISCPCALVISTPVSIVSAISNAARNGVLIKGGRYVEETGALKVVAFDKTGTLTEGRPQVTEVIGLNGRGPDQVLALAAAVEMRSEHPLSHAVLEEAHERGLAVSVAEDLQAVPGLGAKARVNGELIFVGKPQLFAKPVPGFQEAVHRVQRLQEKGRTVIMVGTAQELHGLIGVADQIRLGSKGALESLRERGIERIVMLTGDNESTASAIAHELGVDQYLAELLPEQKVQAVQTLLDRYGKVGMVGDGVNDAPALARASVGVAMGVVGTDAALEVADVALMADDLGKVSYAVGLSRQALRVIRQNIAFSLVVKGLFLALALPGLATLWMAVLADVGASLIVIVNGMRLLRYRDLPNAGM